MHRCARRMALPRMISRLAIVVALNVVCATAQLATHKKVFAGITTAQASAPLPQIGQTMHLLTVVFPAEPGAVSSIQVRLEASFDRLKWFPVSTDITSAPLIGTTVYQVVAAYGPFPFLRVNNVTGTGGKLMHVYYSGHTIPTVPAVTQASDRFLL